jgi:hypothetical protein
MDQQRPSAQSQSIRSLVLRIRTHIAAFSTKKVVFDNVVLFFFNVRAEVGSRSFKFGNDLRWMPSWLDRI